MYTRCPHIAGDHSPCGQNPLLQPAKNPHRARDDRSTHISAPAPMSRPRMIASARSRLHPTRPRAFLRLEDRTPELRRYRGTLATTSGFDVHENAGQAVDRFRRRVVIRATHAKTTDARKVHGLSRDAKSVLVWYGFGGSYFESELSHCLASSPFGVMRGRLIATPST